MAKEHDMRDLYLLVAGMGCRHCVREVTARLRDVPGVESVVADATRSQVVLTGSMSGQDVVRALADTTFVARIIADVLESRAGSDERGARPNPPF